MLRYVVSTALAPRLESVQQRFGSDNRGRRQSSETGDLHTVTFAGGPGHDLVEEADAVFSFFLRGDMQVDHAGVGRLELRQFKVMRGEQYGRARLN